MTRPGSFRRGSALMRRATVVAALWLGAAAAHAQEVVEYYHLDGLGSVRAVSGPAGALLERHDYLPFGEECTTGPCAGGPGVGAGQPRKFTGKERDSETGLDYSAARYYGPGLGRFTSVDPVQVRAAFVDPQQWNRYAYARNNPLRYLDPSGLYVFDESARPEDRDKFEAALRAAKDRAGSVPEGAEIRAALDAYGGPNEPGVTIAFDHRAGGEMDPRGATPRVTFGRGLEDVPFALVIVHEGQHLLDEQTYVAQRKSWDPTAHGRAEPRRLSVPEQERRAYLVMAHAAKAFGWASVDIGGYELWRRPTDTHSRSGINEQNLQIIISFGDNLPPRGR